MKRDNGTLAVTGFVWLAVCLAIGLGAPRPAPGQMGGFGSQMGPPGGLGPQMGPQGGVGPQSADSRVRMRSYRFEEAGKKMDYALFVSSKVKKKGKNKKNETYPLIMLLHGWGAAPAAFMRGNLLDLAQEGGYIVVGPTGYSKNAAFGAPMGAAGDPGGGPANVDELSEKDAMNVLEIMRGDYDIDDGRIYLLGISAGGAGAFHLGVKYAPKWAAVAAIAPASFYLQPSMFEPVKDTLPVVIVHGDADTVVPVARSRRWVEEMAAMGMALKYFEIQGGGHGNVTADGMPHIFEFFREHARPASP